MHFLHMITSLLVTVTNVQGDEKRFPHLPVVSADLDNPSKLGTVTTGSEVQCALLGGKMSPVANIVEFERANGASHGTCHLYRRSRIEVPFKRSNYATNTLSWVYLQAELVELGMNYWNY